MNEELQQAIVKVIESMTGAAQAAYEFGAEQMPDFVQQLIVLNIAKSALIILIFFSFSLFGAFLLIRAHKQKPTEKLESHFSSYYKENLWWDKHGSESVTHAMVAISSSLAFICFFVSIFVEGGQLLKLILAPKVWLIEYAAGLVK